jgi:hypothetical protein
MPLKITAKISQTYGLGDKEGEVFAPKELSFFDPLPEEALRGFPIAKDHDTTSRLNGYKDSFKLGQDGCAIGAVDGLCICLAWHLNGATRDGIPDNEYGFKRSLGNLKGWRYHE